MKEVVILICLVLQTEMISVESLSKRSHFLVAFLQMEPLFYDLVFLISFWLCFALSFIYDNIKFTWLIYTSAVIWPLWIWILPLIYASKSNADAEQNKTKKDEKKENVVAAQGNKRDFK
jgi:hypothetical protein